jgi:hypothetical protein
MCPDNWLRASKRTLSMANCYFAEPHGMKDCYIPFFMLLISNALLVLARHSASDKAGLTRQLQQIDRLCEAIPKPQCPLTCDLLSPVSAACSDGRRNTRLSVSRVRAALRVLSIRYLSGLFLLNYGVPTTDESAQRPLLHHRNACCIKLLTL